MSAGGCASFSMKTKTKPAAGPKKNMQSTAAKVLGGQPENDADARAAGFPSATSGSRPKGGDPKSK